jgi:hypothetical protein
MLDDPIVQLSGIVVLAFAVTWFGERLRIPIILPLLIKRLPDRAGVWAPQPR